MLALSASSRAAFGGAALVAFAAAFAVAPIVARGAADVTATPVPFVPSPAATHLAVVLPRRDPFAGELPPLRRSAFPSSDGSSAMSPGGMPIVAPPMPMQFPARAVPFAPPAGTFAPPPGQVDPSLHALDPRVTAIVTGAHPSALIDEGGSTRLVTIEDRIGDDRIVAIGLDGIVLARGTVLRLTSLGPPIPRGR